MNAAGKLVAQSAWCPESSVVGIVGDVGSGFIGRHIVLTALIAHDLGDAMKRFISVLATSSALAFATGCNKPENTPPPTPTAAPSAQTVQEAPSATPAPPPMPPPNAPKNDSPDPKPGQANDHSSPDFKAGGKK
jgi:hypothetical protein